LRDTDDGQKRQHRPDHVADEMGAKKFHNPRFRRWANLAGQVAFPQMALIVRAAAMH
jgi:hypothetical protein